MSATADPFNCPGCHSGDFPGFDHYCDVLEVPMDKSGQAFAAYLAGRFDWRGECGPMEVEVDGGGTPQDITGR